MKRGVWLTGIFILLTACQPKKGRSGGVDGGGGEVARSTVGQVRAVIDEGIGHFTHSDLRYNLIHLFLDFTQLEKENPGLKEAALGFRNNRVEFKPKGNCPSPDGKHADASVSALNKRANICIAIGHLTRLPPKSLRHEIFGLLMHEAAHLAGGDENKAQKLQDRFRVFLSEQLPELGDKDARAELLDQVKAAVGPMVGLVNSFDPALKDDLAEQMRQQVAALKAALKALDHIPLQLEPLRMKYYTNPKRPELFDNWANTIVSARFKAKSVEGRESSERDLDLAEKRRRAEQALISFTRAEHILRVYLFGRGEPDCELPQGYKVLNLPDGNPFRRQLQIVEVKPFEKMHNLTPMPDGHVFRERLFNVAPPRVCSPRELQEKSLNFDVAVEELTDRVPGDVNAMAENVPWLKGDDVTKLKECLAEPSIIGRAKRDAPGTVLACLVRLNPSYRYWSDERKDYAYREFMSPYFHRNMRWHQRGTWVSYFGIFHETRYTAFTGVVIPMIHAAYVARNEGDQLLWMEESHPEFEAKMKIFRSNYKIVADASQHADENVRKEALLALEYLNPKYRVFLP